MNNLSAVAFSDELPKMELNLSVSKNLLQHYSAKFECSSGQHVSQNTHTHIR